MECKILRAEKSDYIRLMDISEDEWRETIAAVAFTLIQNDNDVLRCYVAKRDGAIIGFIYAFLLPNQTLIPELLYIQPQYRKNGIGKALMNKLETESGCQNSMIFYHKSFRSYYESQGYTVGEMLEVALKELEAPNEV